MGYARFHELRAGNLESGTPLDLRRVALRMQDCHLIAARPRNLQQATQYGAADSPPAPILQYGHATDVAVWQQPSGRNWVTCGIGGQDMLTLRIESIPLERFGNTLLANEHFEANRAQRATRMCPFDALK
jgi:hypothetical protein